MITQRPTIRLGIYEHYKKHDRYEVLGIAQHSEGDEFFVVYQAQYGSAGSPRGGERLLWVRPYEMFIQWVWQQGDTVPRFKYISPA